MKRTHYLLFLCIGAGGVVFLDNEKSDTFLPTQTQTSLQSSPRAASESIHGVAASQETQKTPAAMQRLEEKVRRAQNLGNDPLEIGTERHYVNRKGYLASLRKSVTGAKTSFQIKDKLVTGQVIANTRNADDSRWMYAVKLDDMEGAVLTIHKHPRGNVDGTIMNRSGSVAYRVNANEHGEDLSFKNTSINDLVCGTSHHEGIAGTHALPNPTAAQTEAAQALESEPEEVVADAYTLQSAPSSNRVIYLNFEGETVENTSWNSSYNSNQPINCAVDGSISTSDIQQIWEIVAEDFKPFDVNVTTDRAVYDNASSGNKMMVVFTTSSSWYGDAGGVAYRPSFGSSNYCCFVFTDNLYANGTYAVAASHEVGHTLGLTHDGTSSDGYYDGHGSGYNSWGAIMGAPYGIKLQVWDNGTYQDANNSQDDYAEIEGDLPYRQDDVSGTTQLVYESGNTVNLEGFFNVVSDDAEVSDRYSFTSKGGTISLSVAPSQSGGHANLDLQLTLLDDSGSTVAQDTGSGSLSASISTNQPAGDYTLVVETTTAGGSNGYSKYGQTGTYTLTGTVPQLDAIAATEEAIELANITLGESTAEATFQVFSLTGAPLNYTITSDVSWLTASPATGSVTSEHDTITLTIDLSALPVGQSVANVTVSDDKSTTLAIPVTVSKDGKFVKDSPVTIPTTKGVAGPYPSTLTISNVTGSITKAQVTLDGLSHTYPSDLRVLLVSPAGQKIQLINGRGGSDDAVDLSLTFDDAGAFFPVYLASSGSGVYRPDTNSAGTGMASPAPGLPYSTSIDDLIGHSPNGDWKLYVEDTANQDGGSIDSWTLYLEAEGVDLETRSYAVNSGGSSSINFTCTPGKTYVLESSTNMSGWSTLQTMTPAATTGTVTFTPASEDKQFFRIRQTN